MTSKELIKRAFKLQEVERTPWVPFVGVHAGKLIEKSATEYLTDTTNIVNGAQAAIDTYKPDGIPVTFDLQIEAEALGCQLAWSDNNPPAVISHPLLDGISINDLKVPSPNDGRIPIVLEATRKLREANPDIALYGLITGPFTLALHLLGTDIFIKMMEDPDTTVELLAFCNKVAMKMADYYIRAGCDIIAVVDPMTSQIDPMSFETYVSPPVSELFQSIRAKGALSSFFVCGHAQQNIEVMCKTNPDNVSIDENIPLEYVKEIALANNVSFGGNIKLTVVLLMGTPQECQKDAIECMDIGGTKGFILAPGCDLAMDTPTENIKAVSDLVHDTYQQQVVRRLKVQSGAIEKLDLVSHWKDDKVVIDIITLDSSSCAPCQYMVEAVKHATIDFGGKVEYEEHRIKETEGVQMMATLGVKNIPTIVIDGNIEFISQIPPKAELNAKIEEYLSRKN